jgi:hypothetical protein
LTVIDPSVFALTDDTPANVGVVVFAVTEEGKVLESSSARYDIKTP